MQGIKHAFLDLSVMTELRMLMLSPAPAIVFSKDLSLVYWANAAGSQFFGGSDISNTLQTRLKADQPFIKRLSNSLSKLANGRKLYRGFRYLHGGKPRFMQFSAMQIELPDGEPAVLVCVELKREEMQIREVEVAGALVSALQGLAHSAAILNSKGKVIAASEQFSSLRLPAGQIEKLCKEVAREKDRLIKRPLKTDNGQSIAVGIAHLDQKRNLVVFAEFAGDGNEVSSAQLSDEKELAVADDAAWQGGDQIAGQGNDIAAIQTEDGSQKETPDSGREVRRASKALENVPVGSQMTREERDDNGKDDDEKPALVRVRSTGFMNEGGLSQIRKDDGEKISSIQSRLMDGVQTDEEGDEEKEWEDDGDWVAGDSLDEQDLPPVAELVDAAAFDANENEGRDEASHETSEKVLHFAFDLDDKFVFQSVSDELQQAVGVTAADIVGRSWDNVASRLGFDTYGSIAKLLKGLDTWSGKAVLWPVSDTDMCVPVDLGAEPVFDNEKNFRGYRGFGTVREEDAMLDPESRGANLVAWAEFDERFEQDEPELDNVVALYGGKALQSEAVVETPNKPPVERARHEPFEETDSQVAQDSETERDVEVLNEQEARAFDEIGKHLVGGDAFDDHDGEYQETEADPDPDIDVEVEYSALADLQEGSTDLQLDDALTLANAPMKPNGGDVGQAGASSGVNTEILEQLPSPVIIYRDDEVLFANSVLLERAGYHDEQELERNGGIDAILDMHDVGGKEQMVFKTVNGGRYPVNPVLQSVPWDEEKALLLSFNISGDILPLDEKLALDMARVSELQSILDTATDGIIILDSGGFIESINGSAEALLGYRDLEMAQEPISSLFAPQSHEQLQQYIAQYSEKVLGRLVHEGCELVGLERNGGLVPLYVTIGRSGNNGKLCAVLRDLTPWKKVEQELLSAKREAETASEHKSEFLARVSHELRNPLNSIIGFSDVMIDEQFGPLGNERYREYLRDINRSGVHVLDLINDLLDLSKIEAGRLELSFEAVDINQIVAETVALLQPQANNERVLIRTSLSRAVPRVVADAKSIRQIILNLVSNAIKFCGPGGQVIVSNVYETNGEVALRVRDTGEGMTAEEISIAMKPFHQVQSISSSRNDGTGLGLPLTKALVEANRAHFDIESEKNSGTIVHVQFPAQRVLKD